jgi:hypothetical protein
VGGTAYQRCVKGFAFRDTFVAESRGLLDHSPAIKARFETKLK